MGAVGGRCRHQTCPRGPSWGGELWAGWSAAPRRDRAGGQVRRARVPPLTPACLFQPNSSNDNIQSITSGDWDVTKILSYDEKRNKM